mmetsp:Transcript_29572/g.49730  ORF Transcript_29572/g.49730 Transcript_29572/m.49730 type:complete len:151 (+) Transcript_29572:207-659(+)
MLVIMFKREVVSLYLPERRHSAVVPFFSISTPATKIFRSESTRTQCSVKKEYTSFEEMLEQSDKPILVDFYATWCGPCQMMVPILEEVNEALKEKMRVVKIDTDKYPSIATKYGIGALPTLMLFKGGNPIDKMEGVVPSEELISRINKLI